MIVKDSTLKSRRQKRGLTHTSGCCFDDESKFRIWKNKNEIESEIARAERRLRVENLCIGTRGARCPRLRSRGGDRRDGRDVTGAGNDCPFHSYGNILSLEESDQRVG
ncbi:hypothetical protein ACJJTC_016981 [Scirpophaga incertulas]